MPARLRYWPPADLRRGLIDARTRGLDFDAAWTETWSALRFPEGPDKAAWRAALAATRAGWERAYLGLPATPGEQAVTQLLGLGDGLVLIPSADEPEPALAA